LLNIRNKYKYVLFNICAKHECILLDICCIYCCFLLLDNGLPSYTNEIPIDMLDFQFN